MDGVRAINEMMTLFREMTAKNSTMIPLFVKGAEGDAVAWLEGMDKVADLDVDDAQGCLISALTALATIKVKIRGTEAEVILKEIFTPKES